MRMSGDLSTAFAISRHGTAPLQWRSSAHVNALTHDAREARSSHDCATGVARSNESDVSLSLGGIIEAGGPAGVSHGIAVRGDRARKLEAHERAELEAVARAGGHHPAVRALFLDDEALVVGHGVEADLEPVGGPGVEALEQAAAAVEQRGDLGLDGVAAAVGIARAAERSE